MRKTLKRIVLLFVCCIAIGGCGNSGISEEDYNSVVIERDKLQKENESLQGRYDNVVEELASLQASIAIEEIKNGEDGKQESEESRESTRENNDADENSGDLPFEYYSSGQYKVGTDIDSGEYVLLSESESGAFFSVNLDANGDKIIFNGSFDSNSIVTVNDGEFLVVKRAIAIKYDEFYPDYSIRLEKEGIMIKVGNEIKQGEYKIEGEDGFYSIYSDSRRSKIISNGSIEGSGYINVENGQYLELRRCKISEKTE